MLDYLIEKNGLLGEYIDEKNHRRLTKNHIVLIKRLINPDIDYTKDSEWPYDEPDKKKSFLFEVEVCNSA